MNITAASLSRLEAGNYYLSNTTGTIKKANFWQWIKCLTGLGDGRAKVQRLADAVKGGYEMLYEAGYHPYYMYRQKDTGHGLENTGFAKGDTGCIYNVAMMTDMRDVLSFGAGSSSKRCFRQEGEEYKRRVERCFTTKNAIEYIREYAKAAERKAEFFGL